MPKCLDALCGRQLELEETLVIQLFLSNFVGCFGVCFLFSFSYDKL